MRLIITLNHGADPGGGDRRGLVISILQSITSIQEQTIAFVPKIFAMVLVAVALIPWIVARLIEFTRDVHVVVAGPTPAVRG